MVDRFVPQGQRDGAEIRGIIFDRNFKELAQTLERVSLYVRPREVSNLPDAAEQIAEKESSQQKEQLETEFGDLLFSVINAARLYGVDPEIALERSNAKFIRRFSEMEHITQQEKKTFSDLTLKEMDALWERTKENEDR